MSGPGCAADIERHIGASATLREKRILINAFIDQVLSKGSDSENIYQEFQAFTRARAGASLDQVAQVYGLNRNKAVDLLNSCLHQEEFLGSGQNVTGLKLPEKKLGFGPARDTWKREVESELEQIYNELASVVETI